MRRKKRIKSQETYWKTPFYQRINKFRSTPTDMSTSTNTQNILTIVKDEFTEVLTEGTLSPSTKPADWNVVITEKALLDAMKTPSPLPEETRQGLTALYDNTFPSLEDY
jgi:hypothetical protein